MGVPLNHQCSYRIFHEINQPFWPSFVAAQGTFPQWSAAFHPSCLGTSPWARAVFNRFFSWSKLGLESFESQNILNKNETMESLLYFWYYLINMSIGLLGKMCRVRTCLNRKKLKHPCGFPISHSIFPQQIIQWFGPHLDAMKWGWNQLGNSPWQWPVSHCPGRRRSLPLSPARMYRQAGVPKIARSMWIIMPKHAQMVETQGIEWWYVGISSQFTNRNSW